MVGEIELFQEGKIRAVSFLFGGEVHYQIIYPIKNSEAIGIYTTIGKQNPKEAKDKFLRDLLVNGRSLEDMLKPCL